MEKLPTVLIEEILSFLYIPSDCIIKGYDQFIIVDKLIHKLSRKIMGKCSIENILDCNRCKTHFKAYPLYKELDITFKNNKTYWDCIHFKHKSLAILAINLRPYKFSRKRKRAPARVVRPACRRARRPGKFDLCCLGKGVRKF